MCNKIKCNFCDWTGQEEDLYLVGFDANDPHERPISVLTPGDTEVQVFFEALETEYMATCPNCLTDHYLMDIED